MEMKELQVKSELADSYFIQMVNPIDHFILPDIKTQASSSTHPEMKTENREGLAMSPETNKSGKKCGYSSSDELVSNFSNVESLDSNTFPLTVEQRLDRLEQKSSEISKVSRSKFHKVCKDKHKACGSNLSYGEKDKEKKQPRTRSGRVSKPPSYMVKDYVFVDLKNFDGELQEDSGNGSSNFNFIEEELEPSDEKCDSSSALTTDLPDGISTDMALECSQTRPVVLEQHLTIHEAPSVVLKNRISSLVCSETDHFILPDIKSSYYNTGLMDIKTETKDDSDKLLSSDNHVEPFCGDEPTLVSPKLEPTTFVKEFEILESEMIFEDHGTTYLKDYVDAQQVISIHEQVGRDDIPSKQTSKNGDPIHVDQQQQPARKLSKVRVLNEFTLQHSGMRKRLECNYCGKTFQQKSGLEDHIMIHTGEKPHKCHQCAKTFIQKSGLKQHILTHSGEKPHKCRDCGMTFKQKCKLNDHILVYCDEKNRCSGKAFQQRNHILKGKPDNYIGHDRTKSLELVKRKSYTAQYKLEIIQVAEEKGNRAAAKEYNMSEKNIRCWRKMKGILEKMPQTQTSRRRDGCPPKWPELERKLNQWVHSEHKKGHKITYVIIRKKALELARQDKLLDFTGGIGWCTLFMRRNKLSCNSIARKIS